MSLVALPEPEYNIADPGPARNLGARGSRTSIGGDDPGELTPTATAVLAAIPTWWTARAQAAGLSGDWLDVHRAVDARSPVVTAAEPSLDVTWGTLSGEDVGGAYVEALAPGIRARHGRHYTPRPLAEQLWAMARAALGHGRKPKPLSGLVCDPACGSGALLLPIVREHLVASSAVDPSVVLAGLPSVVEGVDADPAAVWIANVVLAAELLPVLRRIPERRRRPLPALAHVGDGLAAMEGRARLVVMNPPYGRVRLSTEERGRFADVLYGHANLYGLFLGAGLAALDDKGVLAAVVPTSFTSGRYFANLRGEIAKTAPLCDVTFVADRSGVFASVLQETCLAVFARSPAQRTTITSMDAHGVHSVAAVKAHYSSGAWVLPRRSDDALIAAAAATMPLTLAAAGWSVSTGPLVWNRRKTDLYPRSAGDRRYVIWAADVDGGMLHRDAARNAMRYLRIRGEQDSAVMTLETGAILVQRTTAPEQRRRLVAVELDDVEVERLGGVVVENHVNVLRPRVPAPLVSRRTLVALLATNTLDRLTRCISGSVAISAYELESLPLPAASVLASWEHLVAAELEVAVDAAYRPVSKR